MLAHPDIGCLESALEDRHGFSGIGVAAHEDVEGGSRDEVKGGRNATELLRRLEHLGKGAVGLSGEGQRVGGLGSVCAC